MKVRFDNYTTMIRNISRRVHTLSKDMTCFVAYHPEEEHKYEHTKPIPKSRTEDETILKVNSENMITKSPNLEQLQALTYTPARFWRQEPGKDKRIKYREYFNDKKP